MKALIYQPSKTVTQSGKNSDWLLEYRGEEVRPIIEDKMAWTSSTNTQNQVKIKFSSKESAISFAKENNIDFIVKDPKKRRVNVKSYSDNFSNDRKDPWTH